MPVYQLTDDLVFPDPSMAEKDGLLAVGGDLSIERLLLAYSNGIFPWYEEGSPILWWALNPRMVLILENFKVPKSLTFTITLEPCYKSKVESISSSLMANTVL